MRVSAMEEAGIWKEQYALQALSWEFDKHKTTDALVQLAVEIIVESEKIVLLTINIYCLLPICCNEGMK